jgi:xylulokinase
MALVAGVDSSTQSVKVVVCDTGTGQVVRSARADHPEGTEVPAEAWWRAYQAAVADPELLVGVGALAVGGQQHGMVTLDEDDEPVRDALLWNDNRSAQDAVDLIDELGGRKAWADAVGTVPVASITIAKLRWLARAEPENAARTKSVLLPHDYLTWMIGGRSFEPVTDRGDASGTGYFDPARNAYRRDLLERGLGRDAVLPRVAGPQELIGETPSGIALAPGTGDNMAGALALDVGSGEAIISLGTSGTSYTVAEQQSHEPTGTVCGFADATGRFLPLVCTLNCARNLTAAAQLLNVDLDQLSRLAMTAPAGAEGITFMPYLEGERTPPLPAATGELLGLTRANMKPENIARAAIESVLWSLAFGTEVLAEQTGSIDRITLTGGAAQSAAVQQIAAAVFGLPITITEPFESVAVGAARQAAWALTGELPHWKVPVVREIEPTSEDLAAHQEIAERYRSALRRHYPDAQVADN